MAHFINIIPEEIKKILEEQGNPTLTVKTNMAPSGKSDEAGNDGINPSPERAKKKLCLVENCGFSTVHSKDLTRHMRKHTGEKPFPCDRCHKRFTRCDKLAVHLRIHDKKKPNKCSLCEYASVDPSSLRKHMRVHNGERPFKCQICSYAAKDSCHLTVHLRSHTGDCPYVCMVGECKAAFKTATDLKRHNRVHTGDKPYQCQVCDYKTAFKCNLTKHVKKMHEDRPDGEVKKMPRQRKRNGGGTTSQEQHTVTILPKSAENQNNVIIIVKKKSRTNNRKIVPEGTPSDTSSYQPTQTDPPDVLEPTVLPKPSTTIVKKKKTSLPYEYACKTCPFRAPTVSKFSAHLKNGHCKASPVKSKHSNFNEREFKCTQCDAEFFREDSLRCHRIQHVSNNVTSTRSKLTGNHFV